nr:hypothetical protein [Angustibacter aerolatus]
MTVAAMRERLGLAEEPVRVGHRRPRPERAGQPAAGACARCTT